MKALEEVRSKGGEQARGREAAGRERDALNVELRRVSRVCCQLRDKVPSETYDDDHHHHHVA